MAISAAELLIRLQTDASGFVSGLRGAEARLKQAGQTMQRHGRTLTQAVTAPLAAIGTGAVAAFASFDDAMTQSLAIMGDVSGEMRGEMVAAAEEVARTTRLSATEAAESYFFLASAGFDAEESIAALPSVAAFAQAGMFDMATATDLATDAASAMGYEVSELGTVTDTLVRANELANASVEQFSRALTNQAGPALRNVGKSIDEGAAVLAVFADQGVKGEKAGVMLRQAIDALNATAVENAEVFEEYGIQVFDAQGNMRDFADIVADFEDGLGDLTVEQRAAAFEQLGLNVRVRSGITALMGNSDQLRSYRTELSRAGGATQRVADRQMQSFNAQLDVLKSRVMESAREIGDNLAPIVLDLGDRLADVTDRFTTLDEEQQSVILGLASLAASFGPVLIVAGNVVSALGGLSTIITGLVGGGGALVLLAAAAGLIVDNWDAVSEFFSDLYADLEEWTETALAFIEGLWEEHGEIVVGYVGALWEGVKSLFRTTVQLLQAIIQNGLALIEGIWETFGDTILDVVENAWLLIVSSATSGIEILTEAFDLVVDLLMGDWSGAWDSAKAIVVAFGDYLINGFLGLVNLFLIGLQQAFDWAPWLGDKIASAQEAVEDFLNERVRDKVKEDANQIRDDVGGAMEGAEAATDSASRGMTTILDSLRQTAVDTFSPDAGGSVADSANEMADSVGVSAEKAREAFEDLMENGLDPAEAEMIEVRGAADQVSDAQDAMAEAVNASVEDLEAQGEALEASAAKQEALREKVDAVAEEISGDFRDSVRSGVDALLDGDNPLSAAIDTVKGKFKDLVAEGLTDFITKVLTGEQSLKGAVTEAVGVIDGLIGKLGDGEGLSGTLSNVASKIENVIGGSGGEGGVASGIKGLMKALGGAGGTVGMAAAAIAATVAIAALNNKLNDASFATNLAAQVIGGTMGSALLTLLDQFFDVQNAINSLWDLMRRGFRGMGNIIADFARGAGNLLTDVVSGIGEFVDDVGGAIGGFFGGLFGGGGEDSYAGGAGSLESFIDILDDVSDEEAYAAGGFARGLINDPDMTDTERIIALVERLFNISGEDALLARDVNPILEMLGLPLLNLGFGRSEFFDDMTGTIEDSFPDGRGDHVDRGDPDPDPPPRPPRQDRNRGGQPRTNMINPLMGLLNGRVSPILPPVPSPPNSYAGRDVTQRQQINVYLDGDLLTETVVEGMPEYLDLHNLR